MHLCVCVCGGSRGGKHAECLGACRVLACLQICLRPAVGFQWQCFLVVGYLPETRWGESGGGSLLGTQHHSTLLLRNCGAEKPSVGPIFLSRTLITSFTCSPCCRLHRITPVFTADGSKGSQLPLLPPEAVDLNVPGHGADGWLWAGGQEGKAGLMPAPFYYDGKPRSG